MLRLVIKLLYVNQIRTLLACYWVSLLGSVANVVLLVMILVWCCAIIESGEAWQLSLNDVCCYAVRAAKLHFLKLGLMVEFLLW